MKICYSDSDMLLSHNVIILTTNRVVQCSTVKLRQFRQHGSSALANHAFDWPVQQREIQGPVRRDRLAVSFCLRPATLAAVQRGSLARLAKSTKFYSILQ